MRARWSAPSVAAPVVAGSAFGWGSDDSEAVMKCINAWLPMGGPTSTAPDTKCIAAGKMLLPTWAERERAREAVRRLSPEPIPEPLPRRPLRIRLPLAFELR